MSFIISDNPKTGNCSIIFAPIIKEPQYDIMNIYYGKIETYPKNKMDTESNLYIPLWNFRKILLFNFYIKCVMEYYQNWENYYSKSKDVTNQLCIKCKDVFIK